MIEVISWCIAFFIVFGIPSMIEKKNNEINRQNTQSELNKQSRYEMEKWRR